MTKRILLVEDHGLVAGLVQEALTTKHQFQVAWVKDPSSAIHMLKTNVYDVVVVDLLFDELTEYFSQLRRAGKITPTSRFLVSGLAVIHHLQKSHHPAQPVILSAADTSRRLHLVFAYEYLGVRAFCSKDSREGSVENLYHAIQVAASRGCYIDPAINPSLPAEEDERLGERLFAERSYAAIWRALALGYHSREELKAITGYADRTIGNNISMMADRELHGFSPRQTMSKRVALPRLADFASQNWEFFLDETVREFFR